MPRYSRRRADGVVEYHESEEALQRAAFIDEQRKRAQSFAVFGLLAGGFINYLAVITLGGATWPKWARFACVIAGGAATAYVLAKLADIIVMALGLLFAGFVVVVFIMIIWSAV